VAQSLSQFWQAGDVIGSVRMTADLPISMVEFNNRRTVTTGAQRGAAVSLGTAVSAVSGTPNAKQRGVSVQYARGQDTDNFRYVYDISRYEPGLSFSSQRVNENVMQSGQEQFLLDNSCMGGSQTVPHSARHKQQYQCEMRGEKGERRIRSGDHGVTFHVMDVTVRPYSHLVMSSDNIAKSLNRKLVVLQGS